MRQAVSVTVCSVDVCAAAAVAAAETTQSERCRRRYPPSYNTAMQRRSYGMYAARCAVKCR